MTQTTEPGTQVGSLGGTITVVARTTPSTRAETRGVLDAASGKLDRVADIATDKLAASLGEFTEKFSKVLSGVAQRAGAYRLEEVTITVELGVEGEVMLLGTGISASGTAGLELVFKISET